MEKWAIKKAKDREALFTETATILGVSPEIVEKDFWVCWTLHQVFQLQGLPAIIFKGGTSLSKVFGIIQRFSEDIDLVLNRHELGFVDENDPANQNKTNLRDRTIAKLKSACEDLIGKDFVPKLRSRMKSILGDEGWSLDVETNAPDTVLFRYPKGLLDAITPGYIKRVVRLELGCRGDQIPCESGTATPYAAIAFPDQFVIPNAKVNAIAPERTFWEKATILHREFHRFEAGKPISERVFRHYHDVALIAEHHRGQLALTHSAYLLEEVAAHKQHFFREGTARYELAKKGTLRLCPTDTLREALRKDFEGMREMYFGKEPDFDAVMASIRELEQLINKA